jgi:hypothetical protein
MITSVVDDLLPDLNEASLLPRAATTYRIIGLPQCCGTGSPSLHVTVASHDEDRHLYVTVFGGAGGALSHETSAISTVAAASILAAAIRDFDMSCSLR